MMVLMVLGGMLVFFAALLAALGFHGREQVVGIDLGTTFSVVALKSQNQVTVLPDHITGKVLLPSVVTYWGNGSVVVGDTAVRLRNTHSKQTIFNAKRFIGRSIDDVANDSASHPFSVVGNASYVFNNSDADKPAAGFVVPDDEQAERWVSPADVGAEVVRRLGRSVASYLGYPISRAVICVPAKFELKQIKATQQAFEQAGFKVMRVLEEPTAAAIAYNLHKLSGTRHVLIYDIGGGTLDTSLLYMNGKSVNVLGVAGDNRLGGSDFDLRMRQLLNKKFEDLGAEAIEDRQANARRAAEKDEAELPKCDDNGFNILAEQAKIRLSDDLNTEVTCMALDGHSRRLRVTRAEFEAASADLFDRSMQPVAKVLEDQMMTPDHVDDVVLVGGASRTPRLRQLLQEFVGPNKRLHTEIDPDVTVAYGAANILD
jgi:molecular chaperone DnaK (HSP70)